MVVSMQLKFFWIPPHPQKEECKREEAWFTRYVFALFFSPFQNGLNQFLWYCLPMTSKYVRKVTDVPQAQTG